GYSEDDFALHCCNDSFRRLLAREVERADKHLRAGLPLVDLMPAGLRGDMWLFIHGGLAILERIRQVNYDVWQRRPSISRLGKARLLAGALWRNLFSKRAPSKAVTATAPAREA
ncbi:MAG: squalene/phytoene synthase family protein, partial [Singulisphaera sp.]